jgi:amino-acid N-acetyltransferase
MPSPPALVIEPAAESDAEAIVSLLTPHVARQIVLPRSAEDIRAHIRNFRVARQPGQPGLAGCVALRDFGDGLQEIRSLVVAAEQAGHGLGTRLVQTAVKLAADRQARRVFTLTVRPNLFLKLGFLQVPVTDFPQKVWSDCAKCPKREHCDEVALALDLP